MKLEEFIRGKGTYGTTGRDAVDTPEITPVCNRNPYVSDLTIKCIDQLSHGNLLDSVYVIANTPSCVAISIPLQLRFPSSFPPGVERPNFPIK